MAVAGIVLGWIGVAGLALAIILLVTVVHGVTHNVVAPAVNPTFTTTSPLATTAATLPPPESASSAVVAQVTKVSASVSAAVGVGQDVTKPQVLQGQPPLTTNGKPEVLWIGAEFCPYCAAERWSLVMALAHFGTWSGLEETESSPWDTDPSTATFTFRNAAVTSGYVSFVSIEHETNDTRGAGTRQLFQPLTVAQSNLWAKYSAEFGQQTGYPFIDIGNTVFIIGPSYDPSVLGRLNQQEIANKLSNPSDPVTRAIVGTSNYLTAAICAVTGDQPESVCSASGVATAASSMGLR